MSSNTATIKLTKVIVDQLMLDYKEELKESLFNHITPGFIYTVEVTYQDGKLFVDLLKESLNASNS